MLRYFGKKNDAVKTMKPFPSQTKKKLLIVSDSFLPRWDGIARVLKELLPFLQATFSVTLLVPDFGPLPEDAFFEKATIQQVPLLPMLVGDYQFPQFARKQVKQVINEHDLVFTHTTGPLGSLALYYGKRYSKPIIHYVHSIDWELTARSVGKAKHLMRTLTRYYARWILNKATVIAVPYQEVIALLQNNNIYQPEKVVIHLGVNADAFVPVDEHTKEQLRDQLHLPKDIFLFGYIGRLAREKGIDVLLDAFARVKRTHDHVGLVVVGNGIPAYEKQLRETRDIYHVKEGDVLPYLQAIDAFIMPSYLETTSLATLEAMACGKIVLASAVGYMKEYLEEKVNGLLFPRGNALALAIKMEAVLEDPEKYKELGKNARATVLHRFQWEERAKAFVDLLRRF